MMRLLAPLALSSACLLASPAAAQTPIRVLTTDFERSNQCGGLDFTFTSGNVYQTARSRLSDPANFGAGGVVPRPIQFQPPVCCLTPENLEDADVVLVASLAKGLQACELEALADFVAQGGGVFLAFNSASRGLGPALGATPADSSCGGGTSQVADPGSPLIAGPFGTVVGPWNLPCHERFVDVGPNGNAVLTDTNTQRAFAASFVFGSGRAVIVNDEEWMGSAAQGGCAAAQLPDPDRERFLLNLMAWLAPAPGFQSVAGPACSGGTSYCSSNPNSAGPGAALGFTGSTSIAANSAGVSVQGAPPNKAGLFFYGFGRAEIVFGDGFRCVSNPTARLQPLAFSDGAGNVQRSLDFSVAPLGSGPNSITGCCTLRFQYWHRDPMGPGGSGFNLSDGLEVTFLP